MCYDNDDDDDDDDNGLVLPAINHSSIQDARLLQLERNQTLALHK